MKNNYYSSKKALDKRELESNHSVPFQPNLENLSNPLFRFQKENKNIKIEDQKAGKNSSYLSTITERANSNQNVLPSAQNDPGIFKENFKILNQKKNSDLDLPSSTIFEGESEFFSALTDSKDMLIKRFEGRKLDNNSNGTRNSISFQETSKLGTKIIFDSNKIYNDIVNELEMTHGTTQSQSRGGSKERKKRQRYEHRLSQDFDFANKSIENAEFNLIQAMQALTPVNNEGSTHFEFTRNLNPTFNPFKSSENFLTHSTEENNLDQSKSQEFIKPPSQKPLTLKELKSDSQIHTKSKKKSEAPILGKKRGSQTSRLRQKPSKTQLKNQKPLPIKEKTEKLKPTRQPPLPPAPLPKPTNTLKKNKNQNKEKENIEQKLSLRIPQVTPTLLTFSTAKQPNSLSSRETYKDSNELYTARYNTTPSPPSSPPLHNNTPTHYDYSHRDSHTHRSKGKAKTQNTSPSNMHSPTQNPPPLSPSSPTSPLPFKYPREQQYAAPTLQILNIQSARTNNSSQTLLSSQTCERIPLSNNITAANNNTRNYKVQNPILSENHQNNLNQNHQILQKQRKKKENSIKYEKTKGKMSLRKSKCAQISSKQSFVIQKLFRCTQDFSFSSCSFVNFPKGEACFSMQNDGILKWDLNFGGFYTDSGMAFHQIWLRLRFRDQEDSRFYSPNPEGFTFKTPGDRLLQFDNKFFTDIIELPKGEYQVQLQVKYNNKYNFFFEKNHGSTYLLATIVS